MCTRSESIKHGVVLNMKSCILPVYIKLNYLFKNKLKIYHETFLFINYNYI